MAIPELVWTEVDSSNVEAVAYHDDSKTLCVRFNGGGLYSYDQVPHDVYVDLVHAESVGRYLNNTVKPRYGYNKWYGEVELELYLYTLEG